MFDTNILNLIIIGLIFFSLVVIIGILGKNIKKLKEIKPTDTNIINEGSLKKRGRGSKMIRGLIGMFKSALISIAEWFVTHAKKILHLVHFWLIKLRRGNKGDETLGELEAKEELINEEEKSLNTIINEDLGTAQEQEAYSQAFTTRELVEPNRHQERTEIKIETTIDDSPGEDVTVEIPREVEKESKIKNFFQYKKKQDPEEENFQDTPENEDIEYIQQEETMDEQDQEFGKEGQKSWAGKFLTKFNLFKNKEQSDINNEGLEIDREIEHGQNSLGNNFSDGVVKIEKPEFHPKEELLMKEVVTTKFNHHQVDQDDELGVDRKILEKKILQKIAKDPKKVENYRQLGELYIKMKNYSDAEDTYKFIVKISPRDADAKRKIEKIKLLKRLN